MSARCRALARGRSHQHLLRSSLRLRRLRRLLQRRPLLHLLLLLPAFRRSLRAWCCGHAWSTTQGLVVSWLSSSAVTQLRLLLLNLLQGSQDLCLQLTQLQRTIKQTNMVTEQGLQ